MYLNMSRDIIIISKAHHIMYGTKVLDPGTPCPHDTRPNHWATVTAVSETSWGSTGLILSSRLPAKRKIRTGNVSAEDFTSNQLIK